MQINNVTMPILADFGQILKRISSGLIETSAVNINKDYFSIQTSDFIAYYSNPDFKDENEFTLPDTTTLFQSTKLLEVAEFEFSFDAEMGSGEIICSNGGKFNIIEKLDDKLNKQSLQALLSPEIIGSFEVNFAEVFKDLATQLSIAKKDDKESAYIRLTSDVSDYEAPPLDEEDDILMPIDDGLEVPKEPELLKEPVLENGLLVFPTKEFLEKKELITRLFEASNYTELLEKKIISQAQNKALNDIFTNKDEILAEVLTKLEIKEKELVEKNNAKITKEFDSQLNKVIKENAKRQKAYESALKEYNKALSKQQEIVATRQLALKEKKKKPVYKLEISTPQTSKSYYIFDLIHEANKKEEIDCYLSYKLLDYIKHKAVHKVEISNDGYVVISYLGNQGSPLRENLKYLITTFSKG